MSDNIQLKRWVSERLPKSNERTLVLVTGARQTGKTTLARKVYPDLKYWNLDALELRDDLHAVSSFKWGGTVGASILDEAQKLPELFDKIKYAYDEGSVKFSVLLGSSQILLNRRVGESLAGRILIYELWPLVYSERLTEDGANLRPTLLETILSAPSMDALLSSIPSVIAGAEGERRRDLEEDMLSWGGMPGLLGLKETRRREWLRSYEVTYLERDLSDLARLSDLQPFRKFQRLAALRSGRLLAYSELARDAGVSVETSRRYLEYLRLSYQAFLLQPYTHNLTSQLVKTPKLYWSDIGLLRSLTGQSGVVSGELFETWVISDIIKYIRSRDLKVTPSYYRTRSGMEIDLVLEMEGKVFGLEVKMAEKVAASDASSMIRVGEKLGKNWIGGVVVYRGKSIEKLGEKIWAIPSSRLLGY
ncbi:MAG: ATP-binding protein [Lentisphaerota bacterium]